MSNEEKRGSAVDIKPAYLRKADTFMTNQSNMIRHACAYLIIMPVPMTLMVVLMSMVLFGTKTAPVISPWSDVPRLTVALGIFMLFTSVIAFDLISPSHWRMRFKYPFVSWSISAALSVFVITLPAAGVDSLGNFAALEVNFLLKSLGSFVFLMLFYIIYSCIYTPSKRQNGLYLVLFIVTSISSIYVSAQYHILENTVPSSITSVRLGISILFSLLFTFEWSKVTKKSQNTKALERLTLRFIPSLRSEINAIYKSLTRKRRRDWLFARTSATALAQRQPQRFIRNAISKPFQKNRRWIILMIALIVGGVGTPVLIYLLVIWGRQFESGSELQQNALVRAAAELANTWQISPLNLMIIGLVSTSILLVFLAFRHINETRERYIIKAFTHDGDTNDLFLQGITDSIRRSLIKELQHTASALKRRQIENVTFTSEDANAFFISGGIEQEFLDKLEDIGTVELPNLTGLRPIRIWESYLRALAEMFATGNIRRTETGDIVISVSLRYRRTPPVYVRAVIDLRPSEMHINEGQLQQAAREVALKLIIALGQVPGIGQSWETLDELLRGIDAANQQNWWKAISHYTNALNTQAQDTQDDKHGLIYFHLGSALVFQGRWDVGYKMLKKADEYGPATPEIAYMMAFTLLYTYWGVLHEADMVFGEIRAYCQKSIELRPEAPEPYQLLGLAHYRRARISDRKKEENKANFNDDYQQAERRYRQALRLYDRQIDQQSGDKVNNERTLRHLIKQRMTTAHLLGDALRSLGFYAEAEQYYLEMEAIFPGNIRNTADLLKTYSLGQTWQRAQEYFYRMAFNSPAARWDADVLIHAAWSVMGGSKEIENLRNEKDSSRLAMEAHGYLDLALYQRPRYDISWRQSNWNSVFGILKDEESKGDDFYDEVANIATGDFQEHTTQEVIVPSDDPKMISLRLLLMKRTTHVELVSIAARYFQEPATQKTKAPPDNTQVNTKTTLPLDDPDLLFLRFFIRERVAHIASVRKPEERHGLPIEELKKKLGKTESKRYRLNEVLDFKKKFIALINKIIEIEKEVSEGVREGGLRWDFEYIKLAREAYNDIFELFDTIIQENYKVSKLYLTRLGRLVLDIYLRVAMLTARLLAQAHMYALLLKMTTAAKTITEEFVKEWRKEYSKEGKQANALGDQHFTFTPLTFRYQRATILAWNAYAQVMLYRQPSKMVHSLEKPQDYGVRAAIAEAEKTIQEVLKTIVPSHPLALFVHAQLLAIGGRYSDAIREMEDLLELIEPFDPKRDIGNTIADSPAPNPTSDEERGRLYHYERIAGRQQFHHIVNPVMIHDAIADYAMQMGDEKLSITHLSEAVRFTPFSDTHLNIFLKLAAQFSSTEQYVDAQAVLDAAMQPLSRLKGILLSHTRRNAISVMEIVTMTRRMLHAHALRHAQHIARNYELMSEEDFIELAEKVTHRDPQSSFLNEFKGVSRRFGEVCELPSVQITQEKLMAIGTQFKIRFEKITGISLRVGKVKQVGDILTAGLNAIYRGRFSPRADKARGEGQTLEEGFAKLFSKAANPNAKKLTITERLSRIATLAYYAQDDDAARQCLETYALAQYPFALARFSQTMSFYTDQATGTLMQIADICNALGYNRASTTIGNNNIAYTDSLVAIAIMCYLRSVTNSEHPLYEVIRRRLAQYCDSLGWIEMAMLTRDIMNAKQFSVSSNQILLSGLEPQTGDLPYILAGLDQIIQRFEQGIRYDPTRSIIHYHMAYAYIERAKTLMRDIDSVSSKSDLINAISAALEAAGTEMEVVRRNDTHGRLRERLKQLSQRYRELHNFIKTV
jgi:tetratricopeptide (TPR) repeat protein